MYRKKQIVFTASFPASISNTYSGQTYLLLKRFLDDYTSKYFLSGLLDLSVTAVFFTSAVGKVGSTPPTPGLRALSCLGPGCDSSRRGC